MNFAENQFIEVLVDEFQIHRRPNGFELEVSFREDSPCIWLREGKEHVLNYLPASRRESVQQRIDAFFSSDEEHFEYRDSAFPFRLGNGGTLPIVRLQGQDYFILFYRENHPAGWNIANGGANNRYELMHPDAIVERELREELIVTEPRKGLWYVFDWHEAQLRDHPDFAQSYRLWTERFRRRGFPECGKTPLPLKWLLPPDAGLASSFWPRHDSIFVKFGDNEPQFTGQGFLNINAEDFGIEFDRIARLSVEPEAVFCDGELRDCQLLNRIVGLFQVDTLTKAIDQGNRAFCPDRVFWNGEDCSRQDIEHLIGLYRKSLGSSVDSPRKTKASNRLSGSLDLCPVARTLLKRYRQILSIPAPPGEGLGYEVFISFASEDRSLARLVYDHIRKALGGNVFFSDVCCSPGLLFTDAIDRALDETRAFIAVGSRIEHFYKSWVKYEWSSFHNGILSGRKPEHSPFLGFVQGIEPFDLPGPLRARTAIRYCPTAPAPALEALSKILAPPSTVPLE